MDPKQFGQFISAERAAKGMTQKELAEKLGVTDKAISKWERGVCLPDVAKFDNIATALDLTDIEVLRAHRIPPEPSDVSAPEKATPLFVTPREVGRLLPGCFLITFPCFVYALLEDFVLPVIGLGRPLQTLSCTALGVWLALRQAKDETRLNWRAVFDCALVLAALVAAAVLFVGDQPWFLWEAPDRLFGLTEWDDAAEAFLSSLWYQQYLNREWTPMLLFYIYLKYEIFDFPGLIGLLQCLAAYPIAKLLRIRHNQKKIAERRDNRQEVCYTEEK